MNIEAMFWHVLHPKSQVLPAQLYYGAVMQGAIASIDASIDIDSGRGLAYK